jgi:hypothetical protein
MEGACGLTLSHAEGQTQVSAKVEPCGTHNLRVRGRGYLTITPVTSYPTAPMRYSYPAGEGARVLYYTPLATSYPRLMGVVEPRDRLDHYA